MSAVGASGSIDSVYGHTCGMAFVSIFTPLALSLASESGAGASIQSTRPDSSAALRVETSGIGSSTRRSLFGIRSLFQYAVLRSSSARSRGVHAFIFQGPVPDGDFL